MVEPRPLPLFAWQAQREVVRAHRHLLERRAALTAAMVLLTALTAALPPPPLLVWNASASAPIGLYYVTPGARPERGDLIIARLAPRFAALAAQRNYLPLGVPLVKRVEAVPGDSVCTAGDTIRIDGRPVARRLARDAAGRPLPAWQGCRKLHDGAVLLLMPDIPDSFDGRYFGPTPASAIIGTARPLWLD